MMDGVLFTKNVQKGIREAVTTYSDFNISANITHYDPYDYNSFALMSTGRRNTLRETGRSGLYPLCV